MCLPQAERFRLGVHETSKVLFAPGDVLRKRKRGVVAGGQQQAQQQLAYRVALPRSQIHARALRLTVRGPDRHGIVEPCVFQAHQRSHQLGRARDQASRIRVFLVNRPSVFIHHDAGSGGHGRRGLRISGRLHGHQQRRDQQQCGFE